MNLISIIKLALSILPSVISAVQAIEEVLPESGRGKEKLGLVLDVVRTAGESVTDALPTIEKVVGAVVSFLNSVGVFKKGE